MARSTYIYLLEDVATRLILGAFTVKHEMLQWRAELDRPTRVWRHRDGRLATLATATDITEELS
jgi:hypothetical protein